MDMLLNVIQVVLIIATGVILWQLWKYTHSDLQPDDQPLGEERAKYMTDRLDWIKYLLIAEVAVLVVKAVLNILELI